MQAYKLKGKIDSTGNLVITQPVDMPPGDVEVIVLQLLETIATPTISETAAANVKSEREVQCPIPILKEWLEKTQPTPPDFDPDRAKWEYLKEKHNL